MGPYEKIRGTEFPLVTPYFGQHPAHISWMGGGLLEYGTRHEKPAVEWNSGRTASPAWSPISIKISISSKLCARSKQPNVRFVRRCGWVPARAVIQLVSNCLVTKTIRRRRHCTILAGWVDDDDGGVDGYKRPPVWWRRLVHCKNGIPSHLSGDILWDRGVQILKRIRQYVWWPCRLFCWLETTASTHGQRQFHSLYSVWRNPCPTLYTSWILWDICRIKIRSQVNRAPKTEEDWGCRLISSPWFRASWGRLLLLMPTSAVTRMDVSECCVPLRLDFFFLTRWYGISVFFTRPLIMDFMSTFCLLLKIFCGVLDG